MITVLQSKFPLYAIPRDVVNIYEENNILYAERDDGETKIIDNKNLAGTLANRRMAIKVDKLLHLPRTILSMGQLLKSNYRRFVDKNGELLRYRKSMTVDLITVKIHKVIPTDGHGFLLINDKISFPIEVSAMLYEYQEYMRLLKVGNGYMFYSLASEPMEDTWRKI